MAKKRVSKRRNEPSEGAVDDGNVAFQVRLDAATHQKLKAMAGYADISLNQLVVGILRGASGNMHLGRGRLAGKHRALRIEGVKKCVTFGRTPIDLVPEDEREYAESEGQSPEYKDPGQLWFGLDYTDWGVVEPQ